MLDSPSNRQFVAACKCPLRVVGALCLVVAIALFFLNRQQVRKLESPKNEWRVAKSQRLDSLIGLVAPAAEPSPSLPPTGESSALPAGLEYAAEEFTHVPAWMPRLDSALTARAIDATLRSDGSLKGTLRYGLGADLPDALAKITSHSEAAGMRADPSGSIFSSENPPRRSDIRVETTADGGKVITLIYQGTDHEKACACPTCLSPP